MLGSLGAGLSTADPAALATQRAALAGDIAGIFGESEKTVKAFLTTSGAKGAQTLSKIATGDDAVLGLLNATLKTSWADLNDQDRQSFEKLGVTSEQGLQAVRAARKGRAQGPSALAGVPAMLARFGKLSRQETLAAIAQNFKGRGDQFSSFLGGTDADALSEAAVSAGMGSIMGELQDVGSALQGITQTGGLERLSGETSEVINQLLGGLRGGRKSKAATRKLMEQLSSSGRVGTDIVKGVDAAADIERKFGRRGGLVTFQELGEYTGIGEGELQKMALDEELSIQKGGKDRTQKGISTKGLSKILDEIAAKITMGGLAGKGDAAGKKLHEEYELKFGQTIEKMGIAMEKMGVFVEATNKALNEGVLKGGPVDLAGSDTKGQQGEPPK